MMNFGMLILSLATATLPHLLNNVQSAVDSLATKYSVGLKDAVTWLVTPGQLLDVPKTIDNFIGGIAPQMVGFMDRALHQADGLSSMMHGTLESDRLFRLLLKLGTINERGEYANDPSWSEHGDRYPLKLYRDYVFHQTDQDGDPHLDINHMITSLNKLDAGIDERITLTSRDEQTIFVVSYKELKQMFERAFNELAKHSKPRASS
jgi:PAB-dependent poly(A)-specific ribonuclease subunit 3